jgi:hypothetical protein
MRPERPQRLPMKGDDNSAWRAWERACEACVHSDAAAGCTRLGVVEYSGAPGRWYGFPLVSGGCRAWTARA